jgi:hypothetical protein
MYNTLFIHIKPLAVSISHIAQNILPLEYKQSKIDGQIEVQTQA